MGKLLEIRKEFGEPFVDVVKGFAEMGYSKAATARALGIADRYFRDICRRFSLDKFFPKTASERRRECRGSGIGWPKGKPRGTSHNKVTDTELLAEVAAYPNLRLFRAKAKFDDRTVRRRFGSFGKAIARAQSAGFFPAPIDQETQTHPWRTTTPGDKSKRS